MVPDQSEDWLETARRNWRPILAALALALIIGGIAYIYADDLIALAQSLTGGAKFHVQGHIRY